MIHHHLPEHLLAEYAAGATTEAESVLVASHLTLCPHCRTLVAALESAGGALLDEALLEDSLDEPDEIDALLSGVMGQLDGPRESTLTPASSRRTSPPIVDPRGIFPAPLVEHGRVLERRWQRVFPSVERMEIPELGHRGMPLRLFRLRPGSRVPDHEHVGREISMVLTGGFTDDEGHFQRGDVAARGESAVHRQHIDPGEPCIVMVLADQPLKARTLAGHLARLFHTL